MLFKNIPGNNKIKEHLLEQVKHNRVSHAQLFFGESGSAKLALALAYAQFLNCKQRKENDSCNSCSSCIKFNFLAHPDLHLIFPIIKTKNIKTTISENFLAQWREKIIKNPYVSINDWISCFSEENKKGQEGKIYKHEADAIKQKLSLKNYEAEYRVVLIWLAEKMNLEASNKLLKLLEEPPYGSVFLLVSENPEQLLNTIKSRLQKTRIPKFSTKEIIEYFGEEKIDIEEAKELRGLFDADLGEIIKYLNNEEPQIDFLTEFKDWMRSLYKKDIQTIVKWVDKTAKTGRKNQKLFCAYAIRIIRECLILNFGSKELLSTNKREQKFINNFSLFIHEENSVLLVEKLEESIKAIDRNANAKILFFESSLQIMNWITNKQTKK